MALVRTLTGPGRIQGQLPGVLGRGAGSPFGAGRVDLGRYLLGWSICPKPLVRCLSWGWGWFQGLVSLCDCLDSPMIVPAPAGSCPQKVDCGLRTQVPGAFPVFRGLEGPVVIGTWFQPVWPLKMGGGGAPALPGFIPVFN
uniref:Uncharacterized protein n=1 Tax=Sus scrofa TaxID=9823 RepID=A0A4X1VU99_PIG